MRESQTFLPILFSCTTIKDRIAAEYPLCEIRKGAEKILSEQFWLTEEEIRIVEGEG